MFGATLQGFQRFWQHRDMVENIKGIRFIIVANDFEDGDIDDKEKGYVTK